MAPEGHGRARSSSRRGLLGDTLWAGLAAALARAHGFVEGSGWLGTAHAASDDMTRDTFNGLLAFVVPGSDAYSASQGVSTAEPGGVDAGATDVLIATVDESTPFVPGFSAQVAAILNNLAQQVNPNPAGHFASPFASLSFAEKASVFEIMDATDALELLGGILPPFVAFFAYSEAGVFDPARRTITGTPLGWKLSHYQGVADGRAEFLGYFPGSGGH